MASEVEFPVMSEAQYLLSNMAGWEISERNGGVLMGKSWKNIGKSITDEGLIK